MAGRTTPGTVSATLVRVVARAADVSLDELAAEAGISGSAMNDGIIGYADTVQLWEALAARLGDPIAGHHVGSRLRLHEVGVFGPVLAHAPDLRSGLASMSSAFGIALAHGALEAGETDRGWQMIYRRPASPRRTRHGVESLFATIVSLVRQATDRMIECEEVELDTEPPPDPSVFEAFYRAPVRFGVAPSRLLIPRSALSTPMVGRDPAIATILADHAARLLRSESFEERVRLACAEALRSGDSSAPIVARALGLSVRTLHRRLRDAGLQYRDLHDRVAYEYSVTLLRDASLSIDEVAAATGYASRAAFDRAFRRWHGTTPAELRARSDRDGS